MVVPVRTPATFEDLVLRGDPERLEIVDGEIIQRTAASSDHSLAAILLVHRWSRDGYIVVQRAAAGEVVRAEPFEAIELRVGVMFGDDEDDD